MTAFQLLLALFVCLLLQTAVAVEIPPVPDYQVGDVAEASIITPVDLNVIDAEATKRLREKAADNMAPIFRYYPQTGAEVETDFRTAFAQERARFMAAVIQCYRLEKLNIPTVNAPSFGQFLEWVQKQNRNFPYPANLVRLWALGESDEDLLEQQLLPKLRQAMKQYIRPEGSLFETGKPETVTLFAAKSSEAIPELEAVEKRSKLISSHDIYTLPEARAALARSFSSGDQSLARFVAQFLKENCNYDPHLTERMVKKKMAGIWSANRYTTGQVIVKNGETVTANVKAALDALEEKRLAEQKKAAAARARDEKLALFKEWFDNSLAYILAVLDRAEPLDYALWGALVGMLLVWHFVRRHRKQPLAVQSSIPGGDPTAYTVILNPHRNETIFLPVKRAPAVTAVEPTTPQTNAVVPAPAAPPLPVPEAPRLNDAQWLERAKEAEKRAEELLAMVRSGLAPHLAKELMNRLVQELIAQRSALLETQQLAAREITGIESRFNTIYYQLQEQLKVYEKRTQELEGRLASKEEETSEMLRAMIVTQKKLNSTQSGNSGAKD